jgi:hypothetical protein
MVACTNCKLVNRLNSRALTIVGSIIKFDGIKGSIWKQMCILTSKLTQNDDIVSFVSLL